LETPDAHNEDGDEALHTEGSDSSRGGNEEWAPQASLADALRERVSAARYDCVRLVFRARARRIAVPQLHALGSEMSRHLTTMATAEASRVEAEAAAASARAAGNNADATTLTAAVAWEASCESDMVATLTRLQGAIARAASDLGESVVPASAGGASGDHSSGRLEAGDQRANRPHSHTASPAAPPTAQSMAARAFGFGAGRKGEVGARLARQSRHGH
jgi:hypothetical protein